MDQKVQYQILQTSNQQLQNIEEIKNAHNTKTLSTYSKNFTISLFLPQPQYVSKIIIKTQSWYHLIEIKVWDTKGNQIIKQIQTYQSLKHQITLGQSLLQIADIRITFQNLKQQSIIIKSIQIFKQQQIIVKDKYYKQIRQKFQLKQDQQQLIALKNQFLDQFCRRNWAQRQKILSGNFVIQYQYEDRPLLLYLISCSKSVIVTNLSLSNSLIEYKHIKGLLYPCFVNLIYLELKNARLENIQFVNLINSNLLKKVILTGNKVSNVKSINKCGTKLEQLNLSQNIIYQIPSISNVTINHQTGLQYNFGQNDYHKLYQMFKLRFIHTQKLIKQIRFDFRQRDYSLIRFNQSIFQTLLQKFALKDKYRVVIRQGKVQKIELR